MPLVSTCPRCGVEYQSTNTFENVTFLEDLSSNVVVSCPSCGLQWDPTGGEAGTWTTDAVGRVRLVERLASASRSELEALQTEIADIRRRQDAAEATALVHDLGLVPPKKTKLSTGNEALDLVIKLQIVLALLLRGATWSTETVQQLLDQWLG